MSQTTTQNPIGVRVSGDAMNARLTIAAETDPEVATAQACLDELRGQSLLINDAIEAEVEAFVARYAQATHAPAELVIEGKPPVPGDNGRFEWAPGCDPAQADRAPVADGNAVDYYERSPFVTIQAGQVVGHIIPPTIGEVGVNLRGETVPAKPGKPCAMNIDGHSIATAHDGSCRAIVDGVIHFKGNRIAVNPQLDVGGFVDFHTGNIRFAGNVIIHKGVRDRFRVTATGSISIAQLVEAATVETGGDLHMTGGMAAKGAGRIEVGQDLYTRYLANVSGLVKRDAFVEREVIQCDLGINRHLRVERGALIGGCSRVGGSVRLVELGSRAHLKTVLTLGTLPELEQMMGLLEQHMTELRGKTDAVDGELLQLCSKARRSPEEDRRMAELMQAGPELEVRMAEAQRREQQMRERYEQWRRVDLVVDQAIHAGTTVRVDDRVVIFDESIHKPVRIAWTRQRRLVIAVGDGTLHPVEQSPFVRVACAERDDPEVAQPAEPRA